jgi:hypothetical protein
MKNTDASPAGMSMTPNWATPTARCARTAFEICRTIGSAPSALPKGFFEPLED